MTHCADCRDTGPLFTHRGMAFCDRCLSIREERIARTLPDMTIREQMTARQLQWTETKTRPARADELNRSTRLRHDGVSEKSNRSVDSVFRGPDEVRQRSRGRDGEIRARVQKRIRTKAEKLSGSAANVPTEVVGEWDLEGLK